MARIVQRAEFSPDLALQRYRAHPAVWFGPGYAGTALDCFFIGVLCHQVSNYYSVYPSDSRWKRGLVALCFCLSIFKGIESFIAVWEKNIVEFGDWKAAIGMSWTTYMAPASMTFLSTSAQTYFAWRCFTLTGRSLPLLVFLGTTMLTILALSMALTRQIAHNARDIPRIQLIVLPLYILNLVTDSIITSTVWYKLAKARQGTNKTSKAFIDKWITIAFGCAFPPAVSHTLSIVAFGALSKKGAYYNIFNMMTPRLYVFSLMYTLNSRRPIQHVQETMTLSTKATTTVRGVDDRNTVLTLSTFKAIDQDNQTSGFETHASMRPRAIPRLSWDCQQTPPTSCHHSDELGTNLEKGYSLAPEQQISRNCSQCKLLNPSR